MGYKLETHVHTIVSSACGHSTPGEMVRFYKEAGFQGICITDHFFLGNTCVLKSLPWEEWVDTYCRSYRAAEKEGDRIGLDVWFGWETSYEGEDFLILGLDEDWLKAHPEIIVWNQKEQYEHVRADGGFVIQAHPFRERDYMTEIKLHPYHSDAWEAFNACNFFYENRLAFEEAERLGIPMTAGSDIHLAGKTKTRWLFGLDLDEPITDIRELKDRVLTGKYRLIADRSELECEPLNPYFDVTVFDRNNERQPVLEPYYPGAVRLESLMSAPNGDARIFEE
ncbi:MAG: PHP domain-containing protein [Lachnospiraceae bacterium]|nr:PHP domain-containing protein [Lachnospiraceae bacterium]